MKLCIENISKTYQGRTVVDDVSLEINQGQIVGLLGPNGAGKTTSFYIAVGLIPAHKGVIRLHGEDISQLNMSERAKRGIRYLPQEPSIFRRLTVYENLQVALEVQNFEASKRNKRIEMLIQDFGLREVVHQKGETLSGGERRRVEIARALACEPQFFFLDEPFAGVDPISVGEIQDMIKKMAQKEVGVLITDHNVRETLSICDYAYILNQGRVHISGSPRDIAESAEVRDYYLGEHFSLSKE